MANWNDNTDIPRAVRAPLRLVKERPPYLRLVEVLLDEHPTLSSERAERLYAQSKEDWKWAFSKMAREWTAAFNARASVSSLKDYERARQARRLWR